MQSTREEVLDLWGGLVPVYKLYIAKKVTVLMQASACLLELIFEKSEIYKSFVEKQMYAFSLYKCSYREDSLGWGERDRGEGGEAPPVSGVPPCNAAQLTSEVTLDSCSCLRTEPATLLAAEPYEPSALLCQRAK